LDDPVVFADSFNFGPLPCGNLTVGQVADLVVKQWGAGRWEHRADDANPLVTTRLAEATFLKLDITKATTLLKWTPVFSPTEAVLHTIEWYRRRHREGGRFDARAACLEQIRAYQAQQLN
jgi:CDP-glucose 4,6-dehydratase